MMKIMKTRNRGKIIYYGTQTKRALANFPISGLRPDPSYIYAVISIKKAAAKINCELELLDDKKSRAIDTVCDEILSGKWVDQFVVDPYQAGAGTSHNMNCNEVIANRANQLLGAPVGSYKYVHPIDHVNMSQSTNDVIPTAIRIALLTLFPKFHDALDKLSGQLKRKARKFHAIIKPGRTHLQDALPVSLGEEFGAYGKALELDQQRIIRAQKNLLALGIGATAVGTGINTHRGYHKKMVKELSRLTHFSFLSADSLSESIQNTADFLDISSSFRILAHSLVRIGNDLRLLSSGPLSGFAEIKLPAVQHGSSIMPGKVNPSIIEMMTMVSYQVIGFDQAILLASLGGQLEMNVMTPLIAFNTIEQVRLLTKAMEIFGEKCLAGISSNTEMCRFWYDRSGGLGAILNPYVGYDKAAQLVKESLQKKIPLKNLLIQKGILSKEQIEKIFSPSTLLKPNITS